MAVIDPFGANDSKKPTNSPTSTNNNMGLVGWVMSRVNHGRQQRDMKYAARWKEYTRLWRGFWDEKDKNTDSERSRLIAPALQQAIEMTVAEIEEAVFGREAWFGTEDDDNAPDDVLQLRDNLLYDFDKMKVKRAIGSVFLLGAIYGTGIAKIHIIKNKELVRDPVSQDYTFTTVPRIVVEAIRPDEFIIDPSATTIEEALFCAHEVVKPLHTIKEKQAKGLYRPNKVERFNGPKYGDSTGTGMTSSIQPEDDAVLITEYYGKIPAKFIKQNEENVAGLVEAIVTIANGTTLLKAVENPFRMKDRPVVAYQHDTVPGEFWGRGVAEKGFNPQKALDAELRARIDALALMTAPMMGADLTRLPRNPELKVRPGKTVFTRGRPSEIYEPVAFGNPEQLGATFQHTGDLERMVQMGTGAMDSATPININRRNETVGGISALQSGFLKRSKRTMNNIEQEFLEPLIKKALWRYVQFMPQRYPQDYEFQVHATMGLMAKEVENTQLTQMLGFVPPENPAHGIILSAIFENTVSAEKKALITAVKEMNKGPSPEEQRMQQMIQELQLRAAQAELAKTEAETAKLKAEEELARAKTHHEFIEADLEDDLVEIQAANAVTAAEKARVQRKQTEVASERNEIERIKAKNKPSSLK